MNMHISISIRSTTAVPRNMMLVISIMAIAIRSDEDASDITHLSISHTTTKAGINENMLNANTLCCPKKSLHNATIHRYRGGLSAYGRPWL